MNSRSRPLEKFVYIKFRSRPRGILCVDKIGSVPQERYPERYHPGDHFFSSPFWRAGRFSGFAPHRHTRTVDNYIPSLSACGEKEVRGMDDVDIFGVQRGNPKVTGWKSAMQELEARSALSSRLRASVCSPRCHLALQANPRYP